MHQTQRGRVLGTRQKDRTPPNNDCKHHRATGNKELCRATPHSPSAHRPSKSIGGKGGGKPVEMGAPRAHTDPSAQASPGPERRPRPNSGRQLSAHTSTPPAWATDRIWPARTADQVSPTALPEARGVGPADSQRQLSASSMNPPTGGSASGRGERRSRSHSGRASPLASASPTPAARARRREGEIRKRGWRRERERAEKGTCGEMTSPAT